MSSPDPGVLRDLLALLQTADERAVIVAARTRTVLAASPSLVDLEAVAVGQPLPDGDRLRTPFWPRDYWAISGRVSLDRGDPDLEVLTVRWEVAPPLRVGVLGGFRVSDGDGRVYAEGPDRTHPWECLLLLCMQLGKPVSRKQLGRSLWPLDRSDTQRDNLKQVLRRLRSRLKEILGPDNDPIRALPGGMLALDPDLVAFDLADLLAMQQVVAEMRLRGRRAQALALAQAAFLMWVDGDHPLDPEDFRVTPDLVRLRGEYDVAIAQLVETQMRELDGAGSPVQVLEVIRRAARQAWHSEPVMLLVTRMLYRWQGEPLARWAYESLYVPVARHPVRFTDIAHEQARQRRFLPRAREE